MLLPFGAALLLIAGCGQGERASLQPAAPASSAPTAAASPTPTGATAAAPGAGPVAPLTGLPVSAAVARRAAVAVPVPLSGGLGLDRADLVFQEYENPGVLRAIALFQSQDAPRVGPVGQVRPVDPLLLPVLRPLYGNTGGSTGIVGRLQDAEVIDVSTAARPSAYESGTDGLTTSTRSLLAAAPLGAPPPKPQRSYSDGTEPLATGGLRTAGSVSITVAGNPTERWVWSATQRRWTRSGAPRLSVANLVLQTVEYKTVQLKKPIRTVHSARVLGRGACSAASAGKVATCSWYKPSDTALTGYVDAAGVPLRFVPGPTWVVLVPKGSAVVVR